MNQWGDGRRLVFLLTFFLIACSKGEGNDTNFISYHNVKLQAPIGYRRMLERELKRFSYEDRTGGKCDYDIGFSRTRILDHPRILIRFVSNKNKSFPAAKEEAVDFQQINSLEKNVIIFDPARKVYFSKRDGDEEGEGVFGIAIPSVKGLVCVYFYFNDSCEDEELLLIGKVFDSLIFEEYDVFSSKPDGFFGKRFLFFAFAASGWLSIVLFKKAFSLKKSQAKGSEYQL